MTLTEAIAAIEATIDSPRLRVDRKRPLEDAGSYLIVVLDTRGGGDTEGGSVANGPRLVNKRTGTVARLTIPEALARASRMTPAA
ncbi:MAG: hypothetical protein WA892_04535 [Ornithinimicrobium sp.]